MSTMTAAPPLVNGTSTVPADVLREAQFLQQLLQIRDDVFASKHARIHLPAKVIEQVAPRPPQTTPPSTAANSGASNGISLSQLFPPRLDTSLHVPPTADGFVSPVPPTQRPYSTKSASSGIDPVLLTKSDHLIRAELQLKRQQIERQLKDQFDRKGRGTDNEEREAHLNVEECLVQAHLRVPPVSGLRSAVDHSDGAESFDENSYYSSKADSWSDEELDPDHAPADIAASLTSRVKQPIASVAQSQTVGPTIIDLDEEAYEPADDIEIYEPEPAALPDETEEEDYSPPPADVGLHETNRGRARERGNHHRGGVNGPSRRQSPSGPAPPLQNPRKRRRDDKREGKKQRQQQANKQPIGSPEPYIKEEPQSPPALAAYTDSQPSKRRALQPLSADVDIIPAHGSPRAQAVYYRNAEPSTLRYQELDEPFSPPVVSVPQRRVRHDDHDLRRVASLQYAQRPFSPGAGGEVVTAEPRPMRSVSHAFVDRSEAPIHREASARPSAAPRYVRERSRSPVHEYVSRPQSPMMMAPPPRHVVVDQYGNKYYAAPVDAREPAAPKSRRMEVDPYYEQIATREATMRPPRVEYHEDEPVQRMPPPPRRYVDASGYEVIEAPSYRREASRRPVEMEYQPHYEEMGPPREYMPTRSYSMRPEVVRREVAEGFVRHESIQPGPARAQASRIREVSIGHAEAAGERRYYSVAPQSRRYVEEAAVEVAQASYAPRVYTRY